MRGLQQAKFVLVAKQKTQHAALVVAQCDLVVVKGHKSQPSGDFSKVVNYA